MAEYGKNIIQRCGRHRTERLWCRQRTDRMEKKEKKEHILVGKNFSFPKSVCVSSKNEVVERPRADSSRESARLDQEKVPNSPREQVSGGEGRRAGVSQRERRREAVRNPHLRASYTLSSAERRPITRGPLNTTQEE